MAKKNMKVRRTLIGLMTASMLMTTLPMAVSANGNGNGNGNGNTGTGQTQVTIHLDGKIGENKDSITVVVDGQEYQGNIKGSTLEIEMDSTKNGFHFDQGSSMDIGYKNNNDGTSGTLNITHHEGNGKDIDKEHDSGKNNFDGTVKQPEVPEIPEVPEVPDVPVIEEPEIVLMDEEVPLADVPVTGDASLLYLALSALSVGGRAVLGKKGKDD